MHRKTASRRDEETAGTEDARLMHGRGDRALSTRRVGVTRMTAKIMALLTVKEYVVFYDEEAARASEHVERYPLLEVKSLMSACLS